LKTITVALERAGEGPEGAKRIVIRVCAGDRSCWDCREPSDPPENVWRGHSTNISFSGSDVKNTAVGVIMPDGFPDLVLVTLYGVRVAWEAVAKECPEIGAKPPPPDVPQRVEVSFVTPVVKVFETVVMWLDALRQRSASPAEEELEKLTREDVDNWFRKRLQQYPLPRKRRQKAEWFRQAYEQMTLDFEPVPFGGADSLRRYFDKAVQQKKI